jgi:hypothetical protein
MFNNFVKRFLSKLRMELSERAIGYKLGEAFRELFLLPLLS